MVQKKKKSTTVKKTVKPKHTEKLVKKTAVVEPSEVEPAPVKLSVTDQSVPARKFHKGLAVLFATFIALVSLFMVFFGIAHLGVNRLNAFVLWGILATVAWCWANRIGMQSDKKVCWAPWVYVIMIMVLK